MRFAVGTIAVLVAAQAIAQQPPAPAFEAAAIKPSKEAFGSWSWNTHPGSIVIRGMTLKRLIALAYKVKDWQVSGGPKWLDDSRFDINARADSPAGDPQLLAMMQSLLRERFRLVFHRETKVATAYALIAEKSGLKIHPVDAGKGSQSNYSSGRISARGITMAGLADTLSRLLEAPVSDLTEVAGAFDIEVQWRAEGDAIETASALSAVLKDQLGLKLEVRKLPVDFLVVDQAERPTTN